ncbi:hypothetical protein ACJX0J_020099 [Zea mays]
MCFKFFVFLISERFDDSEECLNRLAKPNMNEDVHMNEPKNPEDRLPDMVQDFFRAQEGGAQNSMFAAVLDEMKMFASEKNSEDAQWHKLKRKELQQLWLGVSTFDALSRRDFDLHAALQEDTMLMQMMVNSLLGTFLALPGNMMEVPIFQMAILRGPVQYGWMYPGDISMVWYYVFPLFLLLALVILNEGGFPDIGTLWHAQGEDLCSDLFAFEDIEFYGSLREIIHGHRHLWNVDETCSDEIPNGVVENVDIIDASVDGNMLVIMTRAIPQIQMGLKEIEVQINEHESIICRGGDRSMGFKLPTNPYGKNDNFLCFFFI